MKAFIGRLTCPGCSIELLLIISSDELDASGLGISSLRWRIMSGLSMMICRVGSGKSFSFCRCDVTASRRRVCFYVDVCVRRAGDLTKMAVGVESTNIYRTIKIDLQCV